MTSDADFPESADELYEARGEVSPAYPVMPGDVFEGVTVPGVPEPVAYSMVVMHPCSMRGNQARLRRTLSLAPIGQGPVLSEQQWRTGYVNVMPLPELKATGAGHLADFRDIGNVDSSLLSRDKRAAALSHRGILLLQQRLIFYWTRLRVDLATIAHSLEPILTETELQYEWLEEALECRPDDSEIEAFIVQEETAFAALLDLDNRRLRTMLSTPVDRSRARREVRRAMQTPR